MGFPFPVDAILKDGSRIQLMLADEQDVEPLKEGEPLNFSGGSYFMGDLVGARGWRLAGCAYYL